MESNKYNKLVNKTNKKQTHRYGEQISGCQWGEGRRRHNLGAGAKKKRVTMGLDDITCVQLLRIVKHYKL